MDGAGGVSEESRFSANRARTAAEENSTIHSEVIPGAVEQAGES
jgi:hypothetical protein